ncbi:SRPBCC family protein [Marinicella gelatinilytica]|uniref:SRPBCC family protein n=1 Tax=Marinicella gelatinilytica TaxID=2996017 RepID=UPI002260C27C|nr:SRPBCC family protein [Marinicella gelatinilytica]MCX7546115.1 SRPBCC family protein [Marinicella gelatinilytica]
MRVFKYLFFALLFLIIGFYAYGLFLLKDEVTVSRETTIDRPVKVVYKTVNSMHNFNQWSPWPKMDPDAEFTFQGPETGVGSQMTWSGNQSIGSGVQTIVETVENKLVKTKTVFKSKDNAVSHTTYRLTPIDEDTTKVEWIYETDFDGDILGRYVGSMLDGMLGPQYEQGLQKLKEVVESQPEYDFSAVSEDTTANQNILFIPIEVNSQSEISGQLSSAFNQIMMFMERNQLEAATSPMAIYQQVGADVEGGFGSWRIDAAIGVNVNGLSGVTGELQLGQLAGGQVVKYEQLGSYSQAEKSYEVIDAYLQEHGLVATGAPWEVYINDPSQVSEAELVTHIYQPVKTVQ